MDDLLTDVRAAGEAPLGRRELNKASKRRRILHAATELFIERGYDETTTAAIAKQAGIGAGTLYLYVDSKDDLLVAVFRDQVAGVWDEAFATVDLDRPVLDQLLGVFNHVAAFHERDTNLSRAYFKDLRFVAAPSFDGAEEFLRSIHERLAELLERAQAMGRLDAEVDPSALTENLHAIWASLMGRRHAGRSTWAQYQTDLERSFWTALLRLVPDR